MTEQKKPFVDNTVVIRDCRLLFRNFSGKPDQYTREGARSFHVILQENEAEELRAKGWNVKKKDPREEGDLPLYHLKVNLQFKTKGRPPRVLMVTSKKKTRLDEESVDVLDYARITNADIRFRPYEYEPGKFSAYCVTLFATIEEDELEDRYSDIPEEGAVSSAPTFRPTVDFDDTDAPF